MKKIVLVLLLILIIIACPVKNIFALGRSGYRNKDAEINGEKYLQSLSSYSLEKAKENVKDAKEERGYYTYEKPSKSEINTVLKKLGAGKTTYRKVFKDVYIVGDSLMNGLEAYNILNSNHLITQVSASLYHLSGNMNKIIRLSPPVVILHYGVNMISTSKSQLNNFIAMYSKLIRQIQKGSPDTRIIISGLFPVDRNVARAARFSKIGAYNKALKSMANSLGVEFMDSSSVLKAHSECYGSDGIHLSKSFYQNYWLKFVVKEMGIIG